MAVTVEQQGRTNVSGNRLTVSLKVATDDTSYDANSFPFKATDYVANPDMIHIEAVGGFQFVYNRAGETIEAFYKPTLLIRAAQTFLSPQPMVRTYQATLVQEQALSFV